MTAFTLEYEIDARIDLLAPACTISIDLDEPVHSVSGLDQFSTVYAVFYSCGRPLGVSVLPIHGGKCIASNIKKAAKLYKLQKLRAELEEYIEILSDKPDASAVLKPGITVIIPTCNRPVLLDKCLKGLMAQTLQPERIIVVDNCPVSGNVQSLLDENYPDVEYVECLVAGVSAARNTGASKADSEYLAFLDDDVMPSPGWLENICNPVLQDVRVALVTGLVFPAEIVTESQAKMEALGGFNGGFRARWVLPASGNEDKLYTHLDLPMLGAGCHFLIRRNVFEQIGGFDEQIGAGLGIDGEDTDFYARAIDAGHIYAYEPSATVQHHHRRSEEDFEKQFIRAAWSTGYLLGRIARKQLRLRKSANKYFRKYIVLLGSQAIDATFKPDILSGHLRRRKFGQYIRGYVKGRFTEDEVELSLWRPTTEIRTGIIDRPPVKVLQLDLCRPMPVCMDCSGYSAAEVQLFCGEKYISSLRLSVSDSSINSRQVLSGIPDAVLNVIVKNIKSHQLASAPIEGFLKEGIAELKHIPLDRNLARRPPVSVVIPTRNRPDELAECLWRIARQDYDGKMEILVVDNDQASGLTRPVVEQFEDAEYLVCDKPGSSATRNTGFFRARGEIVVLADDDVLVPPGWVRNMVDKFSRQDVWMVNGPVLPYALSTPAEVEFEYLGGFPSRSTTIEMTGSSFRRNRLFPTVVLGVSANMAFRRSILENPKIGGMSEILGAGLPTGGGEDPELTYRILKEGHTVVFDPSIWVHHQHRKTTGDLSRQLYGYGKSGSAFFLHLLLVHKDFRALPFLLFIEPYKLLMLSLKSEARYSRYWLTELWGFFAGFPAYFFSRIKDRRFTISTINRQDTVTAAERPD